MTAVCLAAGLLFGIASGEFAKPRTAVPTVRLAMLTATPAAPTGSAVIPGTQKSLLLVGVSDTNQPGANLEALWVITFRPGVAEYYILAFPPSATFVLPSLAGSHSLAQIHAEDVRLQLNHNFLRDAIQSRFPALAIQAAVTLDRRDAADLVDQLGGLPMNNQTLSGAALLQAYDSWPANSDMERVQYQGDIMLHLFAQAAQRQWAANDLLQAVTQLPRVSAEADTVTALQAFAHNAPPLEADGLVWRVYSPEMEAATTP